MANMRRNRGFRMGRKIATAFRWMMLRSKRRSSHYQRLDSSDYKTKTMTKLCSWGRSLKQGAKELCCSRRLPLATSTTDYCRLERYPLFEEPKAIHVPKGHLAVYVGQKDDDAHRVLVPIIYFNHPLFGELLREAEKEFGYNHPGGITIPCPISEFEKVKTRIAAGRTTTSTRKHHRD